MQIQIIPKVVSKYSSMSLVSPANALRAIKHPYFLHTQIESSESAGLPACLIGRCCSCFCSWFVLVPLFSCCPFLLCLNQVHPPGTTTTTTPLTTTLSTTLTATLTITLTTPLTTTLNTTLTYYS